MVYHRTISKVFQKLIGAHIDSLHCRLIDQISKLKDQAPKSIQAKDDEIQKLMTFHNVSNPDLALYRIVYHDHGRLVERGEQPICAKEK